MRPTSEIKSLLEYNNASNNELLKSILYSKKDYVVDCRTLSEPEPEVGGELADLPVDRGIIELQCLRKLKDFTNFKRIHLSRFCAEDVVIVAPTASGKTEAFSIPIIKKYPKKSPISHLSGQNLELREKY